MADFEVGRHVICRSHIRLDQSVQHVQGISYKSGLVAADARS